MRIRFTLDITRGSAREQEASADSLVERAEPAPIGFAVRPPAHVHDWALTGRAQGTAAEIACKVSGCHANGWR